MSTLLTVDLATRSFQPLVALSVESIDVDGNYEGYIYPPSND